MPTNTPRLSIPKPLGTETVSRAAFNTIYDTIDANAATRKEPEVLAQDIFASGFVVSGMVASKNATVANQLDVTAGACYIQQADSGLRRFTPAAASFTTSLALATYYLDFQPDGTYSWGTAHSAQTGYLPVAEVTTDAAGAIATVTDKRPLVPGIGKVNADLLRSRNLAAEHDVHLAETAQTNDVHGLKTLFQNQQFTNLLKNGDFASWSAGNTVAPDGWVWAYAASSTIARESVEKKIGDYSCKIVRSGGSAYIYQLIPNYLDYAGKKVTLIAWAKVISGSGRIVISDGVVSNETAYSGSGGWQLLILTFTVNASPTQLRILCEMSVDGTGYFDGVMLVEGNLPVAFANHPNDQHLKAVDYQDTAGTNYKYGLLKMQSGTVKGGTANNTALITFPVAFRKLLCIIVTLRSYGGVTSDYYAVSTTTTSFSIYHSVADLSAYHFYWIAVGVE